MRGIDCDGVGKAEEFLVNRLVQKLGQRSRKVMSQEVGSRRAADDERTAGKDRGRFRLLFLDECKRDVLGGVPRGREHGEGQIAE